MDKAVWTGESGLRYSFTNYVIDWTGASNNALPPDLEGNYIFAKIKNGQWQAVYIGEGILLDRYSAAINEGCVFEKGATNYHAHVASNELLRKAEEGDLIRGNPECLDPIGCNVVVPR